MPFSSLFNRKGSRKATQSKGKVNEGSKACEGKNSPEVTSSETRIREISGNNGILVNNLKPEENPSDVIESVKEENETPPSPDIQTTISGDKIVPDVIHSDIKTDTKSGDVLVKKEESSNFNSEVEVKSHEDINPENTDLKEHCGDSPQRNDEPENEKASEASKLECLESPPAEGTTVSKSPNYIGIEGIQVKESDKLQQPGSEHRKYDCSNETEVQENVNSTALKNAEIQNSDGSNVQKEQFDSEVSSNALVNKEETAESKKEELKAAVNMTLSTDDNHKDADQKITSECSESVDDSLRINSSEDQFVTDEKRTECIESTTDFSESKNNSQEFIRNVAEVNIVPSPESEKYLTATLSKIDGEDDVVVTHFDSSDDNGTISKAKTADVNDQFQGNSYDDGGDETEEKNKCIQVQDLAEEKLFSETKSTTDFSPGTITEQGINSCESEIEDTVNAAMPETETNNHNNQCNISEERSLKEDSIKKIRDEVESEETVIRISNTASDDRTTELDYQQPPEEAKQETDLKDSEEVELKILTSTSETEGNLEEECSASKSLNKENITEDIALENEIVAVPSPNATLSSTHVGLDTASRETEIHENPTDEGTKQTITEDSNSRTEIKESSPELVRTEENNFTKSSNTSSELAGPQSETHLEDISDSFPSECDDFLGGQRQLMMGDQHPIPSWKVGYLQVKLPVQSRGRGKLKVWRQRWVLIQMDEFVKDAKDPTLMISIYASECSKARSHSALFCCYVSASKTVIYRCQSRTHKYAFSISVDNKVILHLTADSETASQQWMTAIRNMLWPPSDVLQLEKVLNGSEFEVSVIDNEFSFHAGLLGSYGIMKVTSNKLILSHPQTDHVIQEWYLNTLDKFQLLPQGKEEDAFKVVVMHTGQDSSTGSGQIILFCSDAVNMLQSIASTIHKLLQYRTSTGKNHNQKELADLAEWLTPAMSQSATPGEPAEDYYKVPRRQIRSLLDIPNFSFDKPLSCEVQQHGNHEVAATKPSMLPSATSASTFSEDSGISMATQPDDFLNSSVTSFTIGGRPVRYHTSSESSDGYSPPYTPEMTRKKEEAL